MWKEVQRAKKKCVGLNVVSHFVRLKVCVTRAAIETKNTKIYLTEKEKYISEVILGLGEGVGRIFNFH